MIEGENIIVFTLYLESSRQISWEEFVVTKIMSFMISCSWNLEDHDLKVMSSAASCRSIDYWLIEPQSAIENNPFFILPWVKPIFVLVLVK